MSALSDLREKLGRSKAYREAFAASVVKRLIPAQIRTLRRQRGWSQAQLANESKLTQGVISRAEDPEYGNLTVNTLVKVGAGFDCAFVGRFVPYSELARWYAKLGDEKGLEVASFDSDFGFVERKEPAIAVAYAGNAPTLLAAATGGAGGARYSAIGANSEMQSSLKGPTGVMKIPIAVPPAGNGASSAMLGQLKCGAGLAWRGVAQSGSIRERAARIYRASHLEGGQ